MSGRVQITQDLCEIVSITGLEPQDWLYANLRGRWGISELDLCSECWAGSAHLDHIPSPMATEPEALTADPEALAASPQALAAGPELLAAGPELLAAGPELLAAGPEALAGILVILGAPRAPEMTLWRVILATFGAPEAIPEAFAGPGPHRVFLIIWGGVSDARNIDFIQEGLQKSSCR